MARSTWCSTARPPRRRTIPRRSGTRIWRRPRTGCTSRRSSCRTIRITSASSARSAPVVPAGRGTCWICLRSPSTRRPARRPSSSRTTRSRRTPGATEPSHPSPRSSWRGNRRRIDAGIPRDNCSAAAARDFVIINGGNWGESRIATRRRGCRPCQARIHLRERDLKRRGQPKRRQCRADREVQEDDGEIERRPRDPARERRPPPPGRGREECVRRVGPAPHDERVRDHDAEERYEQSPYEQEEPLVRASDPLARGDEVPRRADADRGGPEDDAGLSAPGEKVLDGYGGRVHIREGVVGFFGGGRGGWGGAPPPEG